MPNGLINETSPYLLQHADNPVDWYPWGDEAFTQAREGDKPVFLSIGYSACHWCHVMERESFENAEIAKRLNDDFVCIKVDREERPDIDAIYMDAIQALSGHGGWPLSAFLTPDGKPFFGGTYYPPEDRPGMPGFPRVLDAVLDAYRSRRDQIAEASNTVMTHVQQAMTVAPQAGQASLNTDLLSDAFGRISSSFDSVSGGFGAAPKFPQPMLLDFLLRYAQRENASDALSMVEATLMRMADGGIYDHLGGGFHRYSTDAHWLVPHFEKMLYDNALLALTYLHGYQVTSRDEFRTVVEETIDFLLREMRGSDGGFYSTLDADTEGEEGRFYIWSKEEVTATLPAEDATLFSQAFGVTDGGNFEGTKQSVLNRVVSVDDLVSAHGLTTQEVTSALSTAQGKLLTIRQERTSPARDEKVLTSWNGLVLRALAEAAGALDRDDLRDAATQLGDFLLTHMRREDGRILRSYKDGQARIAGYLEDYAFLANGLLSLFEVTFERRWLDEAIGITDAMIDLFWASSDGIFYDTGTDAEDLVVRPRSVLDNAIPSGGSSATDILLRLSALTGDDRFRTIAETALQGAHTHITRFPGAVAQWLNALDFYLATPKEIALIGPLSDPGTQALLSTIHQRYMPNKVVVAVPPEEVFDWDDLPVLDGRAMVNGLPTAFVCENFVCKLPVTDPEALEAQLDAEVTIPFFQD